VKLASLPQGRDGRLIVVSHDLAWYADADHIVPTAQALFDAWDRHAPVLEALAIELEHGVIPRKRFHEREAAALLPRAFAAFADGARVPGDDLRGGRDILVLPAGDAPATCEVGVVVITGDVPQGASPADAGARVRVVGLVNDVVARGVDGASTCVARHFSPVFVAVDALGAAWQDGRLHLPVAIERDGDTLARVPADASGVARAGAMIAQLAAHRPLGAGTLVGTGPLGGDAGFSGKPLSAGETVRIDARDEKGRSVFGAIEQKVARY